MTYQLASLPRPAAAAGPAMPIVPIERVRPRAGSERRAALAMRLAETERALAAAAREAEAWRERTRRFEAALALPARPRPPAAGPGEGLAGPPLHPDLAACLALASAASGEPAADLLGPGRGRALAKARHIAFWLARRRTRLSLKEIGAGLRRDHTSVLHGVRRCEAIARTLGALRWAPEEAARALAEADWRAIEAAFRTRCVARGPGSSPAA